ncbi:PREDICTED: O-acyltransferase WSD1-like isoform X2 [Ipomoea nil]|uniref:O-acyltransferase WSD1-like isoform X2 n=1 Tax=Ipomoea nil TaxID=35883 RepID=UPI000900EEFC|nr:PREDICTED: O-acyltransferase WSD1-like isoform X2 [Ipomoea nil]
MEIPERDEPVTPAGRLFLQPEMNQIIHALIGVKCPWDVEAVKSEIGNSLMVKHPRFSSLMVRDSCGRERWRRTQVNLDDHFVIRRDPISDRDTVSDEDAVNEYLADLAVSSPLPGDKPLWEIHLLLAHNCAVLRIHHSLGDGISIVSLFMSCCRKIGDPTQTPTLGGVGSGGPPRRRWSFKRLMMVLWYTLVYVLEFVLRSLWLKDKSTALRGGAGVELWPRKLATAKFTIDDMKTVKKAVADATINDVLFGVIACGLSRYLDMRSSSKGLQDGLQITGVSMVNLRPQPGLQDVIKLMNSKSGTRWGNKIGVLLLPVNYFRKAGSDPLQFVKRAKAMIDKKKLSLEALCSYKVGDLVMSLLGAKVNIRTWLT